MLINPDQGDARAFDLSAPSHTFTKLTTYQNLYRIKTYGPKGMLLRRITSIADALSCGGLLLVSLTGRWQFWIGQDLRDALAWGQVAMRPVVRRTCIEYNEGGHITVQGGNFVGGRAITIPSRTLASVLDKVQTFDETDVVFAIGIMTPAQYGMGSSLLPGFTGARSYCGTAIAMNTSFDVFMRRAASATIDTCPANVKKYYKGTLEAALAAYGAKNVRPSIAVHTMWDQNGDEIDLEDSAWQDLTRADPESTTELVRAWEDDCNAAYGISSATGDASLVAREIARKDCVSTGDRWTMTDDLGSSWGVIPLVPYKARTRTWDSQGADWHASIGALPRFSRYGPGQVSAADGEWKGFSTVGVANTEPKKAGRHCGVVEGLQAGWYRDFHVLDRSVNAGQRYHETPSQFATLNDMVKISIFPRPTVFDAVTTATTLDEGRQLMKDTETLSFTSYSSFANRGSLLGHIERCTDVWDKKAKAAAEADK